jgi:hypothetical protein
MGGGEDDEGSGGGEVGGMKGSGWNAESQSDSSDSRLKKKSCPTVTNTSHQNKGGRGYLVVIHYHGGRAGASWLGCPFQNCGDFLYWIHTASSTIFGVDRLIE